MARHVIKFSRISPPPPAVTFLSAIFVVCIGLYQFNKQKELEREARRVEHERDIKIILFKEVTELARQCSAKISHVRSSCVAKGGLKFEFSNLEKINCIVDIQREVVALVLKIESHEVIAPQFFKVFRYALLSESHNINELLKSFDTISPEALWDLSQEIQPYIGDLQVGLQNLAFGEIFGEKVPYRTPASDRYKVIENTPDCLTKLEHYFLNVSPWGISCKEKIDKAFDRENSYRRSEI